MKTLHVKCKPVMNAAVALSIMCFSFTSDMVTLLCYVLQSPSILLKILLSVKQ